MRNLKKECFNPFFSHIYVEKAVAEHWRTREILRKFPQARVIAIDHYKDVFCRSRQSYMLQHQAQNLILAQKKGTLLYEGAPVCQSFGNPCFYYTSCIMNCVYDCEYCYLKGMYPSANLVIFVNLEEIFREVEERSKAHPLYLCVSYDTDLAALEKVAGYTKQWCEFAKTHENVKIEVRTKCAGTSLTEIAEPLPNLIYAYTLSPQAVIEAYEHGTPALQQRLACAAELIERGCSVRLCFDPMIYLPDWKWHYAEMLQQVWEKIAPERIWDVSIGTFRISHEYLKHMRKQEPDSAVVWFPFQIEKGYCHYPEPLMEEMENFLMQHLEKRIAKEKIFRWRE